MTSTAGDRPARFPGYSVGVFCGSRLGNDPIFAAAARTLGEGLGRRRWRLVYGGGGVGLMGAVALAARRSGGEVLGVIPRLLVEREAALRELVELVTTPTMAARKERMIAEANAFVVLPGGYGTLDELLEVITLRQLGYIDAPILIVDVAGVWGRLANALAEVVTHGFAEPGTFELVEWLPNVEATLGRLERHARAGALAGGPTS